MYSVYDQFDYNPLTGNSPGGSILPSAGRLWARGARADTPYPGLALLQAGASVLAGRRLDKGRRQVAFEIPRLSRSGSSLRSDWSESCGSLPASCESPFSLPCALKAAASAELAEPLARPADGGGS